MALGTVAVTDEADGVDLHEQRRGGETPMLLSITDDLGTLDRGPPHGLAPSRLSATADGAARLKGRR